MKVVRRSLAVLLAVLVAAPVANAQQHVIGKSALDQAVQQRVARDQADRDAIMTLLQQQKVRDIAQQAGLSIDKATAAVATLEGDDLRQVASQARQVNNELAGGATTVVITTTTIIIILLIVIIIVLLAD
jgi:hypothetical protein